jgi:hypothetical protein
MGWVRAIAATALLIASAPAAFAETIAFEAGQVWSLKAPMDPAARVHIGRVEDNGQVIHISLWGQPIDAPEPLASPLVAGHLPISAEALTSSVDAVVDEPVLEGLQFEEGYGEWQRAHGGVFTISVSEIVDVMIEVLGGQAPPASK